MKKNLLIIILIVIALLLLGTGVYLSNVNNENNEENAIIKEPKKEDIHGDPANVEDGIVKDKKYKNAIVKNILFQKRGELYVLEMTFENNTDEDFYEKSTDIIFYYNTGEEIGRQTINLPIVAPDSSEYAIFVIENELFFEASSFELKEDKD